MFDCTKPVSLAEHLKAIAAVHLPFQQTVPALESALSDFGPVTRTPLGNFAALIDFLLPLKSFTTRFGILALGDWCVLLTDMAGEHCFVDTLAVSRAAHRTAVCVVYREQHREIHVGEDGRSVREVQSLLDVDRWYFRESGAPLFWEDKEDLALTRKRNRLGVMQVARYFELLTGHPLPDWPRAQFHALLGLERCTKEVKNPILRCQTIKDLK